MSGNYLKIGCSKAGLWRWWLENSRGQIVYQGPFGYQSERRAEEAAHKSDQMFVGKHFDAMRRARDTHGPRSLEAHNAERAWMRVLRRHPGLPPDAAFERERS